MKPFCECYCLNVIVNIDSSLNASVNTNLKITCNTFFFVHMQALNEKLKLMGRAKKSFSRRLQGLGSIALWSTKVFWKNFKSSLALCSTYLILFRMGLVGASHGWKEPKNHPFPIYTQKLLYLSDNNEIWHSHTVMT